MNTAYSFENEWGEELMPRSFVVSVMWQGKRRYSATRLHRNRSRSGVLWTTSLALTSTPSLFGTTARSKKKEMMSQRPLQISLILSSSPMAVHVRSSYRDQIERQTSIKTHPDTPLSSVWDAVEFDPLCFVSGCSVQDELFASFQQLLDLMDSRGTRFDRWAIKYARPFSRAP